MKLDNIYSFITNKISSDNIIVETYKNIINLDDSDAQFPYNLINKDVSSLAKDIPIVDYYTKKVGGASEVIIFLY